MAQFCSKCGTAMEEGASFCPNCGNATNSAPQAAPAVSTAVLVKPKVPGRGFGISSMVLGIIGLVYSLYCMSAANLISEFASFFSMGEELIGTLVVYSVLSILAICFGVAAKNRGYQNGVQKSGLVMGIIGLCIYAIAIIQCMGEL